MHVTRTRTALPIIRHFGFPVANLHFNLQLFRRENLKLFILRRIFRRNTVVSMVNLSPILLTWLIALHDPFLLWSIFTW